MIDDTARRNLEDADPYSYRKYGAKGRTQTRDSTRHYYRCNVEGCPARKVIEVSNVNGESHATMMAEHNHDPPPASGGQKRKPRSHAATFGPRLPAAAPATADMPDFGAAMASTSGAPALDQVTKSKRASAQNVSNVIALVKNGHQEEADDDATPPRAAPPAFAPTARPDLCSPRPVTKAASPPACSGAPRTVSPAERGSTPLSSPRGEAARAPRPSAAAYPGHEGVDFDDERIDVMTWRPDDGTLGLLFHGPEREYSDAYAWRKYGKKMIKGYSLECPRFYWRCTNKSCDIKRHTQSTLEGSTEVFYYGRHNHDVPPRKPGRGAKRATPVATSTSPDHQAPARNVRQRRRGKPGWAEGTVASPAPLASDSNNSGDLSEFEDLSRDEASLELPGGEGRCPLFFLACVAAKDPSI